MDRTQEIILSIKTKTKKKSFLVISNILPTGSGYRKRRHRAGRQERERVALARLRDELKKEEVELPSRY